MLNTPDAIRIEPGGDDTVAKRRGVSNATTAAYALVIAAIALAWAPMCSHYIPVADDIGLGHDLKRGLVHYLYHAPHGPYGIWRCIGFSLAGIGVNHPDYYGPAVVTLHAAVTCLLLKTAHRLLDDLRLALLIALAFGVYPAAAQAITWAAAAPIVLLEGFFLLLVLGIFRQGDVHRWQAVTCIAGFAGTFFAQLVQENLVFAFCAVGCILWVPETHWTFAEFRSLVRRRYCGLGPILGAITFIVLWRILPGTNPVKQTRPLRPLSAFTPYLRQDAAALTFAPWFNRDTRGMLAWGWSPSMTVVLIAAVMGTAAAGVLFFKHRRDLPESAVKPTVPLLIKLLMISLGVSSVYALAGGFSLDSRKQYVLVPQMLLVLGWLVRRARWNIGRAVIPIAAGIIITGVPSTWLYVNVWRHECFCLSRLTQTAIDNNISGPVRIEWKPDVYRAWPGAVASWGFRFDEAGIMEPPFAMRGLPRIKCVADAPFTFTFDPAHNRWHLQHNSAALASGEKR